MVLSEVEGLAWLSPRRRTLAGTTHTGLSPGIANSPPNQFALLDPRPDRRLRHADLTGRLRPRPAGVDQVQRLPPRPLAVPAASSPSAATEAEAISDVLGRPDDMGKSKIRVEEALLTRSIAAAARTRSASTTGAGGFLAEQRLLRLRPRLNTAHTAGHAPANP